MRQRFLLVSLALGVMLAACQGSNAQPALTNTPASAPTAPTEISIAAGAPIAIGVSAAMSGAQQGIGQDIADAVRLSIEDHGGTVQGHPVVVSAQDDGCTDAALAVSAAKAFIADRGVAAVIGPMCTTGAQAADPQYEAAHLVHMLPSSTRMELSQQGEQTFFRTAWRDDLQAEVQARYLFETKGIKSAAVIGESEPYGKNLSAAFSAAFEALGGQVMLNERIDRGTQDFGTTPTTIKTGNPGAVVFEGQNPEGALLVKALRTAGYDGLFMAPDGTFSQRDFVSVAGSTADGSVLSAGPQPDAEFIARFHAKFGRDPGTPFVLQAYDATTALLMALGTTAIADAGGGLRIDRERVADAVRSAKLLGLTGVVSFDEHGDRAGVAAAEVGLVVYVVAGGRLEPAP